MLNMSLFMVHTAYYGKTGVDSHSFIFLSLLKRDQWVGKLPLIPVRYVEWDEMVKGPYFV